MTTERISFLPPDTHRTQKDYHTMDRQLQALREGAIARMRTRDIDSVAAIMLPFFRDKRTEPDQNTERIGLNIFASHILPPPAERFAYAEVFCAVLVKVDRYQDEERQANAAILLAAVATCLITPVVDTAVSTNYAEIGAILIAVTGARPDTPMTAMQTDALRRFLNDLTATNGASINPRLHEALLEIQALSDNDLTSATHTALRAIAATVTCFDAILPDGHDTPLMSLQQDDAIVA